LIRHAIVESCGVNVIYLFEFYSFSKKLLLNTSTSS